MTGPDYSPVRPLLRAAAQHPLRPSLIDASTGHTLTVAQSADTVSRCARVLCELGIDSGTRVMVCAANSPWHFIIHLACAWLGAVSVPVSDRLPSAEISERANLVGAALIIGDVDCTSPPYMTVEALRKRVMAAPRISVPPLRLSAECAGILFTSGSTSQARPIKLTHEVLWWGTQNFRDGFEYSPGHHIVGVCAPISHIGGFNGTSLDTFSHGGTVVIFPRFDPAAILRGIEMYRISMMFVVPAMCVALLEAQQTVHADLSSWIKPLVGGDRLSPSLARKMSAAGLHPIHVWGMTETSGAGTMLSPSSTGPVGSIGAPFPYVDLKIIDGNADRVPTGECGEICVRGPGVVTGHEWLCTGDLGLIDQDGWVHIVGRASRMINTGGELVAPPKIEEALRLLPGIRDALVVGVPDERWGQVVAAVVVLDDKAQADAYSQLDFLNNSLAHRLAPWEKIRLLKILKKIPLTINGKPDADAVIELFS